MTPETAFLVGLAVMFMFASVAAGRLRRTHRQEIAELQATLQFSIKTLRRAVTVGEGLADHADQLLASQKAILNSLEDMNKETQP